MRIFISVLFSLFLGATAHAADQNFPSVNGQVEFVLPSGNIGCIYTPKGGTDVYMPEDGGPELSCDRVEPTYQRYVLDKAGKAKLYKNVGDASCCSSGPVLGYGNTWSRGDFWCKSTKSGLTCQRGKNGFFISRAKANTF